MPLAKVSLTETDIQLLRNKKKLNSGFVFRLEKETQDFKNGILKELK